MSKQKIQLKLGQNPNPRVHHVLFAENTPFKFKVVKNKLQYQRKPKHKGADYE